ncbi:MAG TPA: hypothetical protein VF255_03975 [Solirubrobacterales bacterium]
MRWRPLYLVTLVMVLLAAVPAAAPAAEEAAEAPASEAPPPSTGWVPQTPAAEGGDEAPASAQQGSSLGSGGRSSPAPPPSEPPPAPAPSPAPAPADSYYEPETSTPPATEESTSAIEAAPAPAPAPAPEPVAKEKPENTVPPALGGADAVARPTAGVAGELAASAAAAEEVASTVTEDSGLPWLALILCGLVLLYAGVRLLLGPVEPEFFRSGRFRFVRRVFPGA